MADRVPSDHATVSTYRARVARSGGTRRPCLRLPDEVDIAGGDDVRLVLDSGGLRPPGKEGQSPSGNRAEPGDSRTWSGDSEEYHARVQADASGLLIRGAYDLRSEARDPAGAENRLVEWLRDAGREPESSVEFDEVVPGDLYGVRVPGKRAVYSVSESPGGSLRDIAENLDG